MCAQFLLKTKRKDIMDLFGIDLPKDYGFDNKVLPYKEAPVIISNDGELELHEMKFSLIPSWSKEPKVKFATHNARLESDDKMIYEKPTWRGPFKRNHCLVPMTGFIEPIYAGKLAGNMVEFHRPDESPFVAAAIWDTWTDKKTGEFIESFSVLTDDPIPFVAKTGHDRSPVFIQEKAFESWLNDLDQEPEDLVKFLRKSKEKLDLDVRIDRPMKPGWEKRK